LLAAKFSPANATAGLAEKPHSSLLSALMNRPENESTTLACSLAGEVVRRFGKVRLRVFGTSMLPSILPGDLISVQRAGLSGISSGEIVLYSREGRLFAHRVVGRAGSRKIRGSSRAATVFHTMTLRSLLPNCSDELRPSSAATRAAIGRFGLRPD